MIHALPPGQGWRELVGFLPTSLLVSSPPLLHDDLVDVVARGEVDRGLGQKRINDFSEEVEVSPAVTRDVGRKREGRVLELPRAQERQERKDLQSGELA